MVPTTSRPRGWQPPMVMEVDSEEEEEESQTLNADPDPEPKPEAEAVLIRVKDNLNKPARKPQGPREKKYLDILKENTDPEAVFDEVMKQPVTIKFQDLLACSSSLYTNHPILQAVL